MNHQKQINILDLTYYLICPPISGGALRMIAPFTKMDKTADLSVDFLFSTYSEEHAQSCKDYLEKIPVINSATGVVVPMYNWFTDGMPSNISPDVFTTVSPELRDKAVEMVQAKFYDVIQIEHSQLSWIVPYLRMASPKSKIVLDLHNAEYLIFKRWLPYASEMDYDWVKNKYETMYKWEQRVWNWFDAAFTVSSIESQLFTDATGNDKTFWVPTGGGIDPNKYAPKEDNERTVDLLYLGTMSWFPNAQGLLWFLDEIFPLILEKRPNTTLHIAGFGDPNSDLCKRAIAHPNIEFLGQVEDDVACFHRSKVFIVPLWIGAGARVKIPTAMAAKIPMVSTTLGAEGAKAVHGENMLLADTPKDFAECVLKLLEDEEYAKQIADNAFTTMCENYSQQYCADLLVDAYHEIASWESELI